MAEMVERAGEGAATAIPPVLRTVMVRCSQEHAFRVFTQQMGSWWPLAEYSRAVDQREEEGVTAVDVRVEGLVGGQLVEVMSDGVEMTWGEVLAWEPPHRVVYAWKPHARPVPPTEVEVRFTAQGDQTRVDLEHRGWERLGEVGPEGREQYAQGWPLVLERFAGLAAGKPAEG